MRDLIFDNHEPWGRKLALARRALAIYRTLRTAGVVDAGRATASIRLTVDLQPNFALNQPLSPFALAVFELLDPADPTSSRARRDLGARGDARRPAADPVAAAVPGARRGGRRDEGRGHRVRRAHGAARGGHAGRSPLEELLDEAFEVYRRTQPWIGDFELSPKSVVRDMYERAMTFADYVGSTSSQRSEGLVLRYLSDAYRAVRQTIPDEAKTDELLDLIEWLGELVRQVDSSLLDEWEAMVAARRWMPQL